MQAQIEQTPGGGGGGARARISRFYLLQEASSQDPTHTLRSHSTQVGMYDFNGKQGLQLRKTLLVHYAGVRELEGEDLPAFIFPIDGDYDHVRVILDELSLQTVQASLARFPDPLLRQMI